MQDTHKIRLVGSSVIGILLTINFFASSFLEPSGFSWWLFPILSLLILAIWEWGALVASKLDKQYPWSAKFGRRLGLQLLLTCLGALLIFNLPYGVYKWFELRNVQTAPPAYSVYIVLLVNSFLLIFALMVTGLQLSLHFLNKWRRAELEAERSRQETIKAQLDALKNQLDPHFLFNNFNTLYGLIQESPALAGDFLLQLSDIYRYILQHREQEVVALAEEVRVAKAYLFLLQQRYEAALQVHWQLSEAGADIYLVPLTLQMLLENAIKHNVIEPDHPLSIWIGLHPDGYLEVRNSLNRRFNAPSTRLGLVQLKQRYHYLSNQALLVTEDASCFSVKVPLLSLKNA